MRIVFTFLVVMGWAQSGISDPSKPAPKKLEALGALIDPAPRRGANLATLVAKSSVIIVGLVTTVERGATDCQAITGLNIHVTALLKGEYEPPSAFAVFAQSSTSPCKGATHPAIETLPQVSFQEPTLFFFDHNWVGIGEASLVPHLGGRSLNGRLLLGAAPLSKLAAVARLTNVDDPRAPFPPHKRPDFRLKRKTATDKNTGLQWQRRGSTTPLREVLAHRYCDDLVLSGHKDWRLPTLSEAISLSERGDVVRGAPSKVFPRLPEAWFWTGTDDDGAWLFAPKTGDIVSTHYDDPSPYGTYRALCVRSATSPPPPQVPRLRKDGEVVVDVEAQLAWHAPNPPAPMAFAEAVAHCDQLSVDKRKNWRLPTVNQALGLARPQWPWSWSEPDLLAVGNPNRMWTRTRVSTSAKANQVFEMRSPFSPTYWEAGGFSSAGSSSDRHLANAICVHKNVEPPAKLSLIEGQTLSARFANGALAAVGKLSAKGRSTSTTTRHTREGVWKFFDAQGVVQSTVSYVNGVAHGLALETLSSLDDNEDDIVLAYESNFVAGVRHGGATLRDVTGQQRLTLNYCAGRICGDVKEVFSGGKTAFTGVFNSGVATGEVKFWYPNGKPKWSQVFRDGVNHGPWKQWSEKGAPTMLAEFKNGQRHGAWKEWNADGSVHASTTFKDGTGRLEFRNQKAQLVRIQQLRLGKSHGEQWTFQDGKKSSVRRYRDGDQHGIAESWHPNGRIRSRRTFANGKQVGSATQWYRNGKMEFLLHLVAGHRSGKYRRFDEEGRLAEEGFYDDKGRKHGAWTRYYEGKKINLSTYRAGVLRDNEWFFGR